ncbi:MAG: phosphate signaling complex protein PhoU [Oligosphaeraceae bacterium]
MTAHFIFALRILNEMLDKSAIQSQQAVLLAVKAAAEANEEIARKVIEGDRNLDLAEVAIEEECLKILALHQPVAGDLRRVITVLKVNSELERIGDLAVNIADRVTDLKRFQDSQLNRLDFSEMAREACGMLKKALAAFHDQDDATAQEVIRRDETVDALHRQNYAIVRVDLLANPDAAPYYMDCLTISRCLERIADIATNIAEDVIYLETGEIVRHQKSPQEGDRKS